MEASSLFTAWAQLLVRSLEELGLSHVVISPGSRSTPLTWALTQSARIGHSIVIDERSAAFTALGRAKYTGKPCALLCTSGSAAANYLPAIVESSQSHTPLLVITADRPFELQQRGAPQTIDQVKLYGGFVRDYFDLGMPDESLAALRSLRSTIAQAFRRTVEPTPGPVQINFRARKPLEPTTISDPTVQERMNLACRDPLPALIPSLHCAAPQAIQRLAARLGKAQRGVITIGPQNLYQEGLTEALTRILQVSNFSVLCESTGQLRHGPIHETLNARLCDAFDWFFATSTGRTQPPDFVLQIGPSPTSGSWQEILSRVDELELHVVSDHSLQDPSARAQSVILGSVVHSFNALATTLDAPPRAPSAWHTQLARANTRLWEVIDAELSQAQKRTSLSEAVAVRAVFDQLPTGALLALGNSLPVREIDQYVPASSKPVRVISQRGANGIDGVLSGAIGAAATHPGPALCLLGDISYLHDIGALWAARSLKGPFVVAVLNNQGGRIFEQLPLLRSNAVNEQVAAAWLTPHQLDLGAGAALYGLHSVRVSTLADLNTALSDALRAPQVTVMDIRVDPSSAQKMRDSLLASCEAALKTLLA
ncbi:MAG TPA: 2-succinyl-5-enolpyruvyl-6-hydroxy-3-cyclohexene-1-carboxylic-acid synthase [Polyangiaceae bacterium]|nr:2-succinyl-5-enolpyruvyl-6-hydroxy-3-cyclohexene-1-carboxylic-acid synthase [Polyangiaceae bacterium]